MDFITRFIACLLFWASTTTLEYCQNYMFTELRIRASLTPTGVTSYNLQ